MISERGDTLLLVYFNCRGIAQLIRYALFEIKIDFHEIHLNINGEIPEQIRRFNITLKNLPCIIHEGRVIKEMFPIMKYLCYRFNRLDLLGRDIKSQAQLIEAFNRFEKRKCATLMTIFKNVNYFLKNPTQYSQTKQNLIKQLKQKSLGFEDACTFLYSQTGGFLFESLTILDFVFYEKTFYFSNLFGDVCRKSHPILFAYKNFFERTAFYHQHKQKIEEYKLMMPMFDTAVNQGLNKLWVGDKKFLSD